MLTEIRKAGIVAVLVVFAAGCADPSSSRYSSSDVGQTKPSESGILFHLEVVVVEEEDEASRTHVGQ